MLQPMPSDFIAKLDALAANRREIIRRSVTDIVVTGDSYYVSADGCDSADGRTPETAWASLARVNAGTFKPGDAVFFRRGDTFRGVLNAPAGITFSAYGEGDKPQLWASPFDGAKVGKWIPTDVPDIYVYSERFLGDVGCLIFNHGEAYAIKASVFFRRHINRTDNRPFESWRDLVDDLAFYHDLGGEFTECTEEYGQLYLKCVGGNPAERFHSIEFNVNEHGITIYGDNVRINNLRIQYCGCHGIAANTKNGLHVDWCEFEWIGGSTQYYVEEGSQIGKPVRFGNAVEIYGACKDYTIENCYVNQVYDAGLTHQFSHGGDDAVLMDDVTYKGNLIENCVYSIEYFNGIADNDSPRTMRHVRIQDNIMLNAGYGFGSQRPDKTPDAHIKSWDSLNFGTDMVYENNIMFRSKHMMVHIATADVKYMPVVRHNIFVQDEDGKFGRIGEFIDARCARLQDNGEKLAKFGEVQSKMFLFTADSIASQSFIGDDNLFYVIGK